jgi:tetratricopeptide (TPR) repeat protein
MVTRVTTGLFLLLGACAAGPDPVVPPGALPSMAQGGPGELPPLGPQEKSVADALDLLDRSDRDDLEAITILRHHWEKSPHSVEINTALAKAHARVVDTLDLKNPSDREPHASHRNAGVFHAREALKADPNHGAAHYWLGALLLFVADAEQSYGRLKEALKELDTAERLDPKVDLGGPARMKGRIYQETPGFPFLGSLSKANECFRASLKIAPEALLTRLWLAETLSSQKKPDEAKTEAERVTQADARPGFERTDHAIQKRAEDLLHRLPDP